MNTSLWKYESEISKVIVIDWDLQIFYYIVSEAFNLGAQVSLCFRLAASASKPSDTEEKTIGDQLPNWTYPYHDF